MKRSMNALLACCLMAVTSAAFAVPGTLEAVQKQPINLSAIAMFMMFVLSTLGITYWAPTRTKSTADFYTAGVAITGLQNGMDSRARLYGARRFRRRRIVFGSWFATAQRD